MTTWKRNLIAVWISQFCGISGFTLALPFAPFFIQQLGVTNPARIKFWSAVSTSAVAFSIAAAAPVWGILSDRYGRKIMLLRANYAAVIVLLVMGLSPNVYVFVLMRFFQGIFTGTINAAMTVVSTGTPVERQGMALGTLSAGVFAGSFFGPMAGGFLAEEIGYRNTFFLASVFLLAAALVVTFGVRESFVRPEKKARNRPAGFRKKIVTGGLGMHVLFLMFMLSIARTFEQPILPLFVQEIHGRLQGASRLTGMLSGVSAIGAMLAGLILGRLCDRVSPPVIGKISAVGAGVFAGIVGIFPVMAVLFPARFFMAFCSGGLEPVFMVWLSKTTPVERRGTIFGWAVTARSIGWGIAPLLSAPLAMAFGFRPVFYAGFLLYVVLVPVIASVSRKVAVAGAEPAGRFPQA